MLFGLVLILGVAVQAEALPFYGESRSPCVPTNQTSIPQNDCNATARAQAILVKREGYLHGPSLIGNASFFPTGSLAAVMIETAISQFEADEGEIEAEITSDLQLADAAVFGVSLSN
jgi:hypothetical protein